MKLELTLVISGLLLLGLAPSATAHPAEEACPVLKTPTCWALRLACYQLDDPLHRQFDDNPVTRPFFATECTTQPSGDEKGTRW